MGPPLYFNNLAGTQQKILIRRTTLVVTGVLIFNSLYVQASMVRLKIDAKANNPAIVNSFHYYDVPSRETGELLARLNTGMMNAMTDSARHIPVDNVVATIKHENFVILADRQAITLSTLVPYSQQLCNLKLRNVDVVFLSSMITEHNVKGLALLEDYRSISSDVWSLGKEGERVWAHVMFLDKTKLNLELESRDCHSYQFYR